MRTMIIWLLSLAVYGGSARGQTAPVATWPDPLLLVPQRVQLSDRASAAVDASTFNLVLDGSAVRQSFLAALGIEALGGIVGSAIGFGAVVQLNDRANCGENLSCILGNAATAVLLGTVGAAGGAYGAGRLAGTEPSGTGVVLGAVVGAAGIVAVEHVLSGTISDTGLYVSFAVTQGLLTALGSRIGASLR